MDTSISAPSAVSIADNNQPARPPAPPPPAATPAAGDAVVAARPQPPPDIAHASQQLGLTPQTSHAPAPAADAPAKAAASEHHWYDRPLGLLQAAGGVGEAALGAGLLAAPEPTMLTKVAGAAVGLHGIDDMQAGLRTALTGESTPTITQQAVTGGVKALGADPATAAVIGSAVDTGLGAANPEGEAGKLARGVAGFTEAEHAAAQTAAEAANETKTAAAAASIERNVGGTHPSLDLPGIEKGGPGRPHTLQNHVNDNFTDRFAGEPKLKESSTYTDVASAQRAVDSVIAEPKNQAKIGKWLQGGAKGNLPLNGTVPGDPIGRTISRADFAAGGAAHNTHNAAVILKADPASATGYTVLTSYPTK